MWNVLAKIGGWAQFGVAVLDKVVATHPTHLTDWLALTVSLLAAVGIHAAASTDGAK